VCEIYLFLFHHHSRQYGHTPYIGAGIISEKKSTPNEKENNTLLLSRYIIGSDIA
jgi:hypothetical protein